MLGRRLFGLGAAFVCVAAAPAPQLASAATNSSEAAAPAASDKVQAKPVEDKKICKQLPWTGSRMSKRACLTEKEWKQIQDDLAG